MPIRRFRFVGNVPCILDVFPFTSCPGGLPMKRSFRNLLCGFGLVVASTLVTLAMLEALFRVMGLRGLHAARSDSSYHALLRGRGHMRGVGAQYAPYSWFDMNYDSNPTGYFNRSNGIVYKMNCYGLRGEDFPLSKPEGTKRILVLGDSFTFGEGVHLEDTFSRRLERLLAGKGPSGYFKRIEVINAGVGSRSTVNEINYYRQFAYRFEPDLVIVAYVLNDADYAGGLDLWEEFRQSYDWKPLHRSFLLSYCYERFARMTIGRRFVESIVANTFSARSRWNRSFRYLWFGSDFACGQGSRYFVCIFPFMFDLTDSCPLLPVHERIRQACDGYSIPWIDLFSAFKGHRARDLWAHPSDPHPNALGHEIAAKAIYDYIEKGGWID